MHLIFTFADAVSFKCTNKRQCEHTLQLFYFIFAGILTEKQKTD